MGLRLKTGVENAIRANSFLRASRAIRNALGDASILLEAKRVS